MKKNWNPQTEPQELSKSLTEPTLDEVAEAVGYQQRAGGGIDGSRAEIESLYRPASYGMNRDDLAGADSGRERRQEKL